MDFM